MCELILCSFENSTSEVKLLKVQFAEAPAGGRALVTSSDVISLAVFPAALNISEVQVLSAAKRKICLLLSPKFSRRDHEFQTDVLFYIPDWLTDERLYGDTDLDLVGHFSLVKTCLILSYPVHHKQRMLMGPGLREHHTRLSRQTRRHGVARVLCRAGL